MFVMKGERSLKKASSSSSRKPFQAKNPFDPRPLAPAVEEEMAPRGGSRLGFNFAEIDLLPQEAVQPKLILGHAGDRYEQEADRVADRVMRMPEKDLRFHAEAEEETISEKPFRGQVVQMTPDLEALRHYRGCQGDENFFVDLAQARAPVWVASAIADLEDSLRPNEIITTTQITLNRFFHPPSGGRGRIGGQHAPETIQRIVGHLRRMLTPLQTPGLFRCVTRQTCGRENADQDPEAYAYAGRGTPISLCPNFFNLNLTDQISTLIHESAHQIGLMRNVIPREDVMGLSLNQALTNAESYALLVIENFTGPPAASPPPPPPSLTTTWSPEHMSSEVYFNNPVPGLFYGGRGRSRLLSSRQRIIESPFLEVRPIRFCGQVRFYVDTADVPMPAQRSLPEVHAQILFAPSRAEANPMEMYYHVDANPVYIAPDLPLILSFSPDFDFTLTENGRLRTTLWMNDTTTQNFCGMYEDAVIVRPDNSI